MGELAERALLNGPALTKNIDKLVSRGLVQRSVDAQDSRKVLVFISDMGLKTAAWLKKRVDAHHHSIEEALGPQKTMQLKQLLRSFATSAAANSGSPRVSAGAGLTPTSAASGRSALPAKSQRRRK